MIWLSVDLDFFMLENSSMRKFYYWLQRYCGGYRRGIFYDFTYDLGAMPTWSCDTLSAFWP